jgi:PTS system mannose-specific IID component
MTWALSRTFVRSLFLQTLWNFERMQNVGFAFSIVPLLKHLSLSPETFRRMLRRQLQFFNTHPYLAPIVMGVVYEKEKARPNRHEEEDTTVSVLKESMASAFGAVGDHVIWGTWRPFCAVVALGVGLLVAYPARAWSVCAKWWVVGFLVLFNSVHLWLRWRGLHKAVAEGPLVVRWVESLHLQSWAAQIRRIGLVFLVAMILISLGRWASSNLLFLMFAVLLGAVVMKRWALSGFWVFYSVCALSLTISFAEFHWR